MLFDFEDLIDEYSVEFEIISTADGRYSGGEYVPGEKTQIEAVGAIIPFEEKKIYQSGGTLSAKDRCLWMKTPIETPLKNTQVLFEGELYNIESDRDYHNYANAYRYILKRTEGLSNDQVHRY